MTVTPDLYDRFRAKALNVRDEGTEGAQFVGAGLYVSDRFSDESIEDIDSGDFLWIKCRGKTKWSQLKQALQAANHYETNQHDLPAENAQWLANGRTYEDTTTAAEMNTYSDGVIVFQFDNSRPMTTASDSSVQSPPDTTTADPHEEPTPSQKLVPPAVQRTPSTTLSQHATPTQTPSQIGRQYETPLQQASEYPHPIRPPSNFYETPARASEEILAQARERSASSRGTPSAMGMSQLQHDPRSPSARAIDQIRMDQNNREALEKALAQAKSKSESKLISREKSLGSYNTSASVKPESTTPRASPVTSEQAAPRSPSPVPDRPVTEFFEPTNSQNEEAEPPVAFQGKNLIQKVVNSESLELLEDAVQIGGHILKSLEHQLDGSGSKDATHWLGQIAKLKQQMTRTRTVVGVVGNTGAGKSSVINALLDEERLVPTSCMRACTAVVTEISWNESDKPYEKYRAEIEFITRESWEKELEALVSDMTDSNGELLRDATTTSESDAGIALQKLKSVYPQTTREDLADMSPAKFANHSSVKNILGTTKRIKDSNAASFYRQLQVYVDSVEDREKEKDTLKKKEKRKMEFWPLIKVVRIFTRSDALSTGAVLVDLPGVQDSNAARGAVAESYKKQCSGLWVVAPITRAVNDKAAKDLMGDQFKRQMKFDGMVSNLTFICSKIDDISITEAAGSLGLDHQIQEASEKKDQLEIEKDDLAKEIKTYQEEGDASLELQSDLDEKVEVCEELKVDLEGGKQVLAPRDKKKKKRKEKETKKRKRKPAPSRSRKRVSRGDSDDDFIDDGDDDDVEDTDSESENDQDAESDQVEDSDEGVGEPLTAEQIQAKLDELKAAKKQAREDAKSAKTKAAETRKKVRQVKEQIAALESEMSAVCIAGRNDYSKGRIQEDYAAGIRELDQEAAEQEDEDAFDPEVQIRDYEELARSLPVFCVSSRAYQKLSGRLKKDTATPGFTSFEETGMVQLKAHCKKLTETGRLNHCKVFLNGLSSLLLSLNIWGSNDGTGKNMSKEEKERERGVVKKLLKNLENAMDKTTELCSQRVKDALVENIRQQYDLAHSEARKVALPTAQAWGNHRDDGGLAWATYKAVCRRDGGPWKEHDFNKALTEPLQKVLASGWEKCFQRYIPRETKALANDMNKTIETAHRVIVKRATERQGLGIVGADMLAQKLETWIQLFVALAGNLNALIMEKQRDANRELAPVIALAMQHAYTLCVEESGSGSYKRMKTHMTSHVSSMVDKMYPDATATVWARLEAMLKEASSELENEKDIIYESMYQDYMNVLCGTHIDGMMPKWERTMRGSIADEVAQTDKLFQSLLDGENLDAILSRNVDAEATEEVKKDEDGSEGETEAAAEKEKPAEASVKAESPHDSGALMASNDDDTSGDFKPEFAEPTGANDASNGDEMDVDE
ncbi:hypothetical protein E6O75_ATG02546 [Venturia nashicola]|uniref:Nuclear GTPase SLIP-GC n=1 Tax=Venturia nashicola TaxID=86259 RepID=A0A4Z1PFT0_9PEZI|nr:hypothetical protein E6O75_ATG02546 [Venturia nashicola]